MLENTDLKLMGQFDKQILDSLVLSTLTLILSIKEKVDKGYTLSGIDTTSMPVFLYPKRTTAALMLYNQFTTKIM